MPLEEIIKHAKLHETHATCLICKKKKTIKQFVSICYFCLRGVCKTCIKKNIN